MRVKLFVCIHLYERERREPKQIRMTIDWQSVKAVNTEMSVVS